MNEIITLREFSLGSGVIYMAPGKVSESELEDFTLEVGETEGGCVLLYEYKTKELCDVDGNIAATLKFGERLTVKGKLRRMAEHALPMLISGDRDAGGTGEVSVLLVCPLPDRESFRLYVRGGVPGGAVFNVKDGGGVEFSLTCGKNFAHPSLSFKSTLAERGIA